MTKRKESRIWIEYETSFTGGEASNPEEEGEVYVYRKPMNTLLEIKKLYRSEPTIFFKDSIEVAESTLNCKMVYLVVARYFDGDSFGTYAGKFQFYSIRETQEEALADRLECEGPGPHRWDGYFCGLENVEVHLMLLHS